MGTVIGKPDRVRHLVRHLVYRDCDADASQKIDNSMIELGNRLRFEQNVLSSPKLVRATSRWLMKSNSISRISSPIGIGDVPSPRALT